MTRPAGIDWIRRRISLGAGRCEPREYVAAGAPLTVQDWRAPYMGVACPEPNSIRCDRVGLAVWVERPASRVAASIAGRRVTLRTGAFGPGRRSWQGFLRPAGLLDGPLRVRPDRGRYFWEGRHSVFAYVRLAVRYRDGGSASGVQLVMLSAGWG